MSVKAVVKVKKITEAKKKLANRFASEELEAIGIQSKIESGNESKIESQPESKIESQPESKIESQPESKIESGNESKIESGNESKIESQPENQLNLPKIGYTPQKPLTRKEQRHANHKQRRLEQKRTRTKAKLTNDFPIENPLHYLAQVEIVQNSGPDTDSNDKLVQVFIDRAKETNSKDPCPGVGTVFQLGACEFKLLPLPGDADLAKKFAWFKISNFIKSLKVCLNQQHIEELNRAISKLQIDKADRKKTSPYETIWTQE